MGAGAGIGAACARTFSREGAEVVVAARRRAPLEELAAAVSSEYDSAVHPIVADLADVRSCRTLVDGAAELLGGLDAVVTVATASGGAAEIADADWTDWRTAFDVNVIGTMEVCRSAAATMQSDAGGSIVLIGTFGTHSLPPRRAAYNATKQAAVTAAKTFAKEVGPSGVRVNVVTPGYVAGDSLDELIESAAARSGRSVEDESARWSRSAALRRHDPDDIASTVAFLCSAAGRSLTGLEIPVTAGQPPL